MKCVPPLRAAAALLAAAAIASGASAAASGRGAGMPLPKLPPRSANGGFLTINHGVDRLQAAWHVRAALNVAALGCDDPALVAAYNRLLVEKRALLGAAYRAVQVRYAGRGGATAHDLYMTRLYNYFSQPFVHGAFCRTAATFVASGAADRLDRDPNGALSELEAPFLGFYERYAAYVDGRTRSDARAASLDLLAYSGLEDAPARRTTALAYAPVAE